MFEIVLPISIREEIRRNLDRLSLLLKSLSFFWTEEQKIIINIIVPDLEFEKVFEYVEKIDNIKNLNVRIRPESDVSSKISNIPSDLGVMKQMLLKLASFDFVEEDYVLLLDSDVVVCKPFNRSSLIKNGRALTEWLTPTSHGWWNESARVLGYNITPENLSMPRIFVTPQILSKKILVDMLNYLENIFKKDWISVLTSEYSGITSDIWTEYTLYDLFSEKNNLRHVYHLDENEYPAERLHSLEQSLWNAEQFFEWKPELALNGQNPGYFLVLQSITASVLNFDLVQDKWNNTLKTLYPTYII